MHPQFLPRFVLLLTLALGTSLFASTGWAQVQHPSTVVSTDAGCVLILCGAFFNVGNAVDNDSTTAATISPPLAVGSAALRLRFPTPVPAGATLRLRVSYGGLLGLGLLANTSIRTFAGTSATVQQSADLGTLLNLGVLTGTVLTISFPVTASFTDFELRTGSLLNVNVGYALNLHYVTAVAPVPLPVELVRFTGRVTAAGTELAWETASEKNSAYFQVERATDPSSGFTGIGQLPGAGTSTSRRTYRYVDVAPAGRFYYRLRHMDADNSFHFSPVVSVQAAEKTAVHAYPNPVTHLLTITGPAGAPYTLLDGLGQVVQSGHLPIGQQLQLDLGFLPTGVYVLRSSAEALPIKVLKVRDN